MAHLHKLSQQDDLSQELLSAARDGKVEEVEKLLNAGVNVNSCSPATDEVGLPGEGYTPLHVAVLVDKDGDGDETMVRLLLERGANVEAKDNDGMTPLELAAIYGRQDVGDLLMSFGANIAEQGTMGQTALHKVVTKAVAELCAAGSIGSQPIFSHGSLAMLRPPSLDTRNLSNTWFANTTQTYTRRTLMETRP